MPTRQKKHAPRRARGQRRPTPRAGAAFDRLVDIMDTLRSPGGCPWDRKQTHATLRPYLVEETYEALDAIDRRDLDALAGELGDILLQCVFHARIAAETGRFDIVSVVDSLTAKLIRRHPHVFTPDGRRLRRSSKRTTAVSAVTTPQAVVEQWTAIKAREQADKGRSRRVLTGVPRALPALLGSHKIGSRVAAVGFDWPNAADVVGKIEEEVRELRDAVERGLKRSASEEMGDLLFSIANLSRKLGIEPESALRAANRKFTRRFDAVEKHLERRGRSVHEATLEELEEAWNTIKKVRTTKYDVRRTP